MNTSDSWRYDPEYFRFANFLHIGKDDKEDVEVAEKLSLLYDWAKDAAKSDKREDIYSHIEDLRKGLGTQRIGRELVEEMHTYARLEMDKNRIDKLLKTMKPEDKKEEVKQEVKKEEVVDKQPEEKPLETEEEPTQQEEYEQQSYG